MTDSREDYISLACERPGNSALKVERDGTALLPIKECIDIDCIPFAIFLFHRQGKACGLSTLFRDSRAERRNIREMKSSLSTNKETVFVGKIIEEEVAPTGAKRDVAKPQDTLRPEKSMIFSRAVVSTPACSTD